MATVERHGKGWRAIFTGTDGTRTREVVPAETKAHAKELAAKLERRAWLQRRGLEVDPTELTGTLADLCSWWIEKRCPAASRDGGATAGLQLHVIRGEIGKMPLCRLRPAQLDDLLHEREHKGAAPATLNNLRAQLHTIFAQAKKAGRWVGENPMATVARRKVPKRAYRTLTPEQLGKMLVEIPEDWRPLFACGPALGLRKGELLAVRKCDVDLARRIVTISRSHDRDTTKGGDPAALPIPAPLLPWLEHQLQHAPGPLLFPAPDGSQRSREADPQKILRHALARAGIVDGYEHRCRWCGYKERADDAEPRFCKTCLKTTDGRGRALVPARGKKLWPKALHVPMRFHDLRHTFATELLRRGVDVYRVQRLMRHSDVRVTTGTYAHLLVEDLRAAVDAHSPLLASSAPKKAEEPARRVAAGESAPIEPQPAATARKSAAKASESAAMSGALLERETGVEPATLSLGTGEGSSVDHSRPSQPLENQDVRALAGGLLSQDLAGLRRNSAPIQPQGIAQDARSAPLASLPALNPPRALRLAGGARAWLRVAEVAQLLQVSTATVYRLIERGELAHARVSNAVRISPADLNTYIARRTGCRSRIGK